MNLDLLAQSQRVASTVIAAAPPPPALLVAARAKNDRARTGGGNNAPLPVLLDFTADIDFALAQAESSFQRFQRRPKKDVRLDDSTPQPPADLDHYLVNANSVTCALLSRVETGQRPFLAELKALLLSLSQQQQQQQQGLKKQTLARRTSPSASYSSRTQSRSRSPDDGNVLPPSVAAPAQQPIKRNNDAGVDGDQDPDEKSAAAAAAAVDAALAAYRQEMEDMRQQRDQIERELQLRREAEARERAAAQAERERERQEALVAQQRERRRDLAAKLQGEVRAAAQQKQAAETAARILRGQTVKHSGASSSSSSVSIREIFASSSKKRAGNSFSAAASSSSSVASFAQSSGGFLAGTEQHLRRLVWRRVCELDQILLVSSAQRRHPPLTVGIDSTFLRSAASGRRRGIVSTDDDDEDEQDLEEQERNMLLLGQLDETNQNSNDNVSVKYLSVSSAGEEVVDVVVSLVADAAVALTAIRLLVFTRDLLFAAPSPASGDDEDVAAAPPPPLLYAPDADGGACLTENERHHNWRKVLQFARHSLGGGGSADFNVSTSTNNGSASRRSAASDKLPPFTNVLSALAAVEDAASVFAHVDLDAQQREQLLLKRACEFLACVNQLLRQLVPMAVLRSAERSRLQHQHEAARRQENQRHFFDQTAKSVSGVGGGSRGSSALHSRELSRSDSFDDAGDEDKDVQQQQQQQQQPPQFLRRSASFQRSSLATKRSFARVAPAVWAGMDRSLSAWVNSLGVLPHLALRSGSGNNVNNNTGGSGTNSANTSSYAVVEQQQQQQSAASSLRLPFETLVDPPLAVRAAYVSPFACCASADQCGHVSHNCDAVYKQQYHHHHNGGGSILHPSHARSSSASSSKPQSRDNSVVRAGSVESVHASSAVGGGVSQTAADAASSSFVEQHRSLRDPDILPFLTNGTVLCNIINLGLGQLRGESTSQRPHSNSSSSTKNAQLAVGVSPPLKVYENPRTVAHCRANVDAVLHFLAHEQRLSSSKFADEMLFITGPASVAPSFSSSSSRARATTHASRACTTTMPNAEPILAGDFTAIVCVLEALRLWWSVIAQRQQRQQETAGAVFAEARRVLNEIVCGTSRVSSAADVEARRHFDWVGSLLTLKSKATASASSRAAAPQRDALRMSSMALSSVFVDPLSASLQRQLEEPQPQPASDLSPAPAPAPITRGRIQRGGGSAAAASESAAVQSANVSFLSPVAVVVNSPVAARGGGDDSSAAAAAAAMELSRAAMSANAANTKLSFM